MFQCYVLAELDNQVVFESELGNSTFTKIVCSPLCNKEQLCNYVNRIRYNTCHTKQTSAGHLTVTPDIVVCTY